MDVEMIKSCKEAILECDIQISKIQAEVDRYTKALISKKEGRERLVQRLIREYETQPIIEA